MSSARSPAFRPTVPWQDAAVAALGVGVGCSLLHVTGSLFVAILCCVPAVLAVIQKFEFSIGDQGIRVRFARVRWSSVERVHFADASCLRLSRRDGGRDLSVPLDQFGWNRDVVDFIKMRVEGSGGVCGSCVTGFLRIDEAAEAGAGELQRVSTRAFRRRRTAVLGAVLFAVTVLLLGAWSYSNFGTLSLVGGIIFGSLLLMPCTVLLYELTISVSPRIRRITWHGVASLEWTDVARIEHLYRYAVLLQANDGRRLVMSLHGFANPDDVEDYIVERGSEVRAWVDPRLRWFSFWRHRNVEGDKG